MDCVVKRGELRQALTAVKPAAFKGASTMTPAVLIEATHDSSGAYAMLTTGDGEVMASMRVNATVNHAGSFPAAIPALTRAIGGGKAGDEVTLATDDVVAIGEGEATPRMWCNVPPVRHAIDAATLEVVPVDLADGGSHTVWNLDEFGNALRRVSFAKEASNKLTARTYLKGVFVHERDGKTALVATDGSRLALAKTSLAIGSGEFPKVERGPRGFILPPVAVTFLEKVCHGDPAMVRIAPDGIHVQADDFSLKARDFDEGSYPPVDQVFPDPTKEGRETVTFDIGAFSETIRAAKPDRQDVLTLNGYCTIGRSTALEGGPPVTGEGVSVYAARFAEIGKVMGGEVAMNYEPGGTSPLLLTSTEIDGYSVVMMTTRP